MKLTEAEKERIKRDRQEDKDEQAYRKREQEHWDRYYEADGCVFCHCTRRQAGRKTAQILIMQKAPNGPTSPDWVQLIQVEVCEKCVAKSVVAIKNIGAVK